MKISLNRKKRLAVSPVIATLLLIAIAVAAAIIVYAFVTGLIGGLSSGAGSSLITVSGQISIPGGTGAGLLSVSIKNGGSNPISGITVAVPAPPLGGVGYDTMSYSGANVAITGNTCNPQCVPIGQSASGSLATTAGSAGTTYTLTVTVEFQSGSTTVQTYDITAQT